MARINFRPPSDPDLKSRVWVIWFSDMGRTLNGLTESGSTADRPTRLLFAGRTYFDTDLSIPIWYKESTGVWVNAAGTTV
jgi:hypothetical protein